MAYDSPLHALLPHVQGIDPLVLGDVGGLLLRNWWWLLAVLLTLALAASLVWYVRGVSLRRLPVPGFFLIALILHVCLGFATFYVHFGEVIVRQIRRELRPLVVAPRLSPDQTQHEPVADDFEKIADLTAADAVNAERIHRQATESPALSVPSEAPVPKIVARADRSHPERIAATLPHTLVQPTVPSLIRRPTTAVPTEEPAKIEPTAPAHRPAPSLPKPLDVTLDPQPTDTPKVDLSRHPPQLPEMPRPIPELSIEQVLRPAELPTMLQEPLEVARAMAPVEPAAREADLEAIAAPVPERAEKGVEPMAVEVERGQTPAQVASRGAMRPPGLPRQPAPLRPAADLAARVTVERLVPVAAEPSLGIGRAVHSAMLNAVPEIATEAVAPLPDTTAGEALPERVPIGLPRRAVSLDAASLARVPGTMEGEGVRVQPANLDIARQRASSSESMPIATSADPKAGPIPRRNLSARPMDPAEPTAPAVPLSEPPAVSAASALDLATAAVEIKPHRGQPAWQASQIATIAVGLDQGGRRPSVAETLAKESVDAPPTFDSLAGSVARRSARRPQLLYAEDAVGLQAMFRLRRDEFKREAVAALGGSDQSLEAIRLGLAWLGRHQHSDGYWSLNAFHNAEPGKRYTGQGSARSDSAATALALLPFLGDGQTHLVGEHQAVVQRGIAWLLSRQGKDGELVGGQSGQTRMYAHALATIALCEAYGMTRDEALRAPAERALAFLVSAQHKPSGGWRYQPNQAADTSVVGWQVLAIKSGQMAGVEVPGEVLEGVGRWLEKVEGSGKERGRFRYQAGRPISPAMTAEALLCLQFMGTPRHDARLQSGVDYLLEHLPKPGRESSYYWYYATQVVYHMQGEPWQKWNDALRDMLVKTQLREGHLAGTWDPKDQWERSGGRLYATSLRLLMLEVYYRHLPLYQVLGP